jgi:GTPase
MFVDQIRIQAKAGDGGNGCVSFRREKFVPKGGPDGGDGGKGGDIILRTDIHKDNLVDFYYQPILRAKRGEHGLGKNMYGKAGADSIYKVPIGTVVYRIPPQKLEPAALEEDGTIAPGKVRIDPADCQLVADLAEKDQEFILCRGGAGGKGNTHFKSSRNRVPRQFTEAANHRRCGTGWLSKRWQVNSPKQDFCCASKDSSLSVHYAQPDGWSSRVSWLCARYRCGHPRVD